MSTMFCNTKNRSFLGPPRFPGLCRANGRLRGTIRVEPVDRSPLLCDGSPSSIVEPVSVEGQDGGMKRAFFAVTVMTIALALATPTYAKEWFMLDAGAKRCMDG